MPQVSMKTAKIVQMKLKKTIFSCWVMTWPLYFFLKVTHYSMWLLVSWAHCSSTVKSSLADSDHLHDWLKKLTLLVPEVSRSCTSLQ